MKIIIGILFAILQSVVAVSDPDMQHIINGTDTKPGEVPYMAGIRRYDQDIYCGGALISDKHVLTAAHCGYGYNDEDLTVLLGTHDLLNGGQYFNVEKITISADYNTRISLGIAILTLSETVQFSNYISKIPLPKNDAPDGVSTTLTGYGYQEKDPENGHMSQILQKLPVTIVNQQECVKKLAEYEKIEPQQLCGFTDLYHGACYGDSGSPLVYDNTIIGLALSVYPDCAEGHPDVYARITHYLNFIEQTIA